MRIATKIAALSIAIFIGNVAGAAATDGVTPEEVASVIKAKGYEVTMTTDDEGDPLIKSKAHNVNFDVKFYGCKVDRCVWIQFNTGFDYEQGLSYELINRFNREKGFGQAYLDDDMDPWLDFSIDLERGNNRALLESNFDRWLSVLKEFITFIDYKPAE
jgi:hypothetical protein